MAKKSNEVKKDEQRIKVDETEQDELSEQDLESVSGGITPIPIPSFPINTEILNGLLDSTIVKLSRQTFTNGNR